ncbi:MAG TPA: beta-propeller domain-containing protein [Candidatus Sulfotelmatobacter sp.]|jgi:inhibitor of cysteine peptidase|nr:beta-propeller domain-containing protein [Candidatus Sulfotelmatobacter sp.]
MQLGSKTRTIFGLTLGIIAGLALILLPGIVVLHHPTNPTVTNQHVMVPFTSYEELHSFILTKSCNSTEVRNLYNPTPAPVIQDTKTTGLTIGGLAGSFTTTALTAGASTSATPSHSQTNAQVAGVDELDTVKNDGTYIYTITNNTVAIVLAYPVTDAKLLAHVSVNGSLQGIFVDGNKLVVVSQQFQQYPLPYTGTLQPGMGASIAIYPIFLNYPQTTSLSIFDISNHSSPVLTTTLVVNGTLAGSRLIGDYAYLVATQPVYCNGPILLPENVVNGRALMMGVASVYHSDIADVAHSFTTVVGINVTQVNPTPAAKIFLIGTSSNIYVSVHQIYLTQPIWSQAEQTAVHRISIDGGSISYQATGTVSGHVLNQFSMDEYNGNFRIATTGYGFSQAASTGAVWSSGQQQTNLYVLDNGLHIIGRLEGLSPGEAFYAARFMGDRAYLVTFQRLDPLFVIGLQDPHQPKVLGQLNIPGVSDYLQPYDETHLIGFGKSSTNVTWENAALFQGLKLSLFDVTDPSHPIDTSDYLVGARGSDSPALTDHKSVLFDRSLNLLVIPLSIAQNQTNATCTWCYNPLVWQGAYVFNVTVQNGIAFRGGITHLPTGQLPSWNNSSFFVTRALYIGSALYTISNNMVKVNSLSDLTELNSVSLA